MSISDIIKSIVELTVIAFIVWGLFHEDRIVALEEKLFAYIRRKKFKIIKGSRYPRRKR